VERFEDLIARQRARELTRAVYATTRESGLARDYGLKDQLQRAAVTVMSNIAEGFERGGRKEFAQFLFIAKASCAEVRSLLYVALDAQYLDEATFDELMRVATSASQIIDRLRASVAEPRTKAPE